MDAKDNITETKELMDFWVDFFALQMCHTGSIDVMRHSEIFL